MPPFAQPGSDRFWRYELMLALGIADERQILRLPARQLEWWKAFARVRLDKKARLAEDGNTLISWWD